MKILKSLTVLYAEDDQVIRESTERTLGMFFHRVVTAKDGMEAIELFRSNTIHVAILDYMMPFLDGYDVAKTLKETNKNIPVVITSAYTDKEKLLKVMDLKLVSYLEKPLLKKQLLDALQGVVKSLQEHNLLMVAIDEQYRFNSVTKILFDQDDKEIMLTKIEVEFLEMLLSNRGFLLTKQMIEERLFQTQIEENALRNMVFRFRKKLNSDKIVTVKNLGYLLAR